MKPTLIFINMSGTQRVVLNDKGLQYEISKGKDSMGEETWNPMYEGEKDFLMKYMGHKYLRQIIISMNMDEKVLSNDEEE